MLDTTEKRIVAACEALMDDTLDLTRDLVRGYSVLGQELGALDTMEAWFERLGLPATRVPLEAPGFAEHPHRAPTEWPCAGRYNLVSQLNVGAPGPTWCSTATWTWSPRSPPRCGPAPPGSPGKRTAGSTAAAPAT